MRVPGPGDLRDLCGWRPPSGVISVYVDLHPEDRGEAWRTEIRNALAGLQAEADPHDGGALSATAERIRGVIEDLAGNPSGRTQIGFIEVARKPAREEWFAVQVPLGTAEVTRSARPLVRPLVAILAGSEPRAIAVVSAERVRLLIWTLGETTQIDEWGLEIVSLDWRERKAKRSADPARVQGAKASGRDQYGQRLDANRERFLSDVARLAGVEANRHDANELIVFGDPEHADAFAASVGDGVGVPVVEHLNLIGEPASVIADRARALIDQLKLRREHELVTRVVDEARGGDRGALGLEETAQALAEGRVEHLLLDGANRFENAGATVREALAVGGNGGADVSERMIELALASSATVTPLGREAAEAIAESEGVGAILRY